MIEHTQSPVVNRPEGLGGESDMSTEAEVLLEGLSKTHWEAGRRVGLDLALYKLKIRIAEEKRALAWVNVDLQQSAHRHAINVLQELQDQLVLELNAR